MKKSKLPMNEKELNSVAHELLPADAETKKFAEAFIAKTKAKRAPKSSRVTTRLNRDDLLKLQEIAAAKGLAYQTLMGSIIHQYVTEQLIDIQSAEVFMRRVVARLPDLPGESLSSKRTANEPIAKRRKTQSRKQEKAG